MKEHTVQPMRCIFASGGLLVIDNIAAGLGILIFSPQSKIAAGMHVLRAYPKEGTVQNPLYCASTAIPYVVGTLKEQGAQPPYSVALAGGGSMLPLRDNDVGSRLLKAAREALQKEGLSIKREETGGSHVRVMILNITEGKLKIDIAKLPM